LFFGYGTQHVITRSVRDSATALDVIAGPERASFYRAIPPQNYAQALLIPVPPLRIALTTNPFLPADVHPTCDAAARKAATFCEDLGHTVEEEAPNIDREEFGRDYTIMCAAGVSLALRSWEAYFGRSVGRPDIEEVTALYREIGNNLSGTEVLFARDRLMAVQREMARFFRHYHVLLTPTLALPPVKIGHFEPTGLLQKILDLSLTFPFKDVFKSDFALQQIISWVVSFCYSFTPYAPLANIAGLPSMNVPLFQNQNDLPIGVMFTSALGRDTLLFRLAAQLESAHPWRDRRPTL
jgi:amidase